MVTFPQKIKKKVGLLGDERYNFLFYYLSQDISLLVTLKKISIYPWVD
jgi:hypothetical protein